jgi:hypothetical protein
MKPETETFHQRLVAALEVEDDRDLVGALSEVRAPDIAESFELLSRNPSSCSTTASGRASCSPFHRTPRPR